MRKGKCLQTLYGHKEDVYDVTIAPDESIVSVSADTTVKIWSPLTFDCVKSFSTHTSTVTCLCLDPRFIISGGADKRIKLWS